nr:hypothetical protein [Pseudomonas sp. GW458-11-26-14-LB4]
MQKRRDKPMEQNTSDFEMTALLVDLNAIREYLSQVLAEGDDEELFRAIGYVTQARIRLTEKVTAPLASPSCTCLSASPPPT